MRALEWRACVLSVRAILKRVYRVLDRRPRAACDCGARSRFGAWSRSGARLRLGVRPRWRATAPRALSGGAPFQMKQIIPFRLHIDRAKWDFLLHLEYRDGERVRSPERVTKKVPTGVETLDVTSGGDEGNPRAAAPPAPASARDRASRAAPENARAFPRLRVPNGVRSPGRVTRRYEKAI